MEIKLEATETKGQFSAVIDQKSAGLMTFSVAGKDKIIIDHTEVNPEFNGKGVGKALVMAAVTHARQNQIKILPLCPFAKSVFAKDSSIRDVLV